MACTKIFIGHHQLISTKNQTDASEKQIVRVSMASTKAAGFLSPFADVSSGSEGQRRHSSAGSWMYSWPDTSFVTDSLVWKIGFPVTVGAVAVVAAPAAVAAAGFGAGGIAAGSLAAKGMSLAATSGYGMSVIAGLQSIGAAGLTTFQALTVGGAVATGVGVGVGVGISGSDSSSTSTTTSSSDSSGTEDKKKTP
ncbi:dachshund homolog 1-like isoform X2 [Pomacea canaliculata]|uniref:dachshund homolog 1-like isoform X2 n=1 Tax=Pomacea canaliculata TaxID=400727 RepID=UPI000D73E8D0|nr:dachshund homolog 1-like isoform X2 [Pomacea canaliculata]